MAWLKFYPTQTAENSRLLKHSKIGSLDSDFDNDGNPFTIFLAPKSTSYDVSVLLDVQLLEDDALSPLPFLTNQWSPCIIRKIGADSSILSDYDIYVGAGR